MNKKRFIRLWMAGLTLAIGSLGIFHPLPGTAEENDPWKRLQEQVEKQRERSDPKAVAEAEDPWTRLRAIYLPFSEAEEKKAVTDTATGRSVAGKIRKKLKGFAPIIAEASSRFNVPTEIISAVIMVESGGDADARARTSSASGLMQTITATFQEANTALAADGILIVPDPFDPRASIMAGTWYLNRMYAAAAADRPDSCIGRDLLDSWKYPLEYYYAGPGYGARRSPVVIIYSNGRKIVVDKAAYSGKVFKWAKILRSAG